MKYFERFPDYHIKDERQLYQIVEPNPEDEIRHSLDVVVTLVDHTVNGRKVTAIYELPVVQRLQVHFLKIRKRYRTQEYMIKFDETRLSI